MGSTIFKKFEGTDFSWENAHLAVLLASGIHDGEEAFADLAWEFGYAYEWLKIDSLEAALMRGHDSQILVFRGTRKPEDWLVNLNAVKVETRIGKVHRGFLKAAQAYFDLIKPKLEPQQPLWICGYSLGGALSQLNAVGFRASGFDVKGIYTFGAPMTGGQTFVDHTDRLIGQQFFRFVNKNDIVPQVPFGMVHAGREIEFGANGAINQLPQRKVPLKEAFNETLNPFLDAAKESWTDWNWRALNDAVEDEVNQRMQKITNSLNSYDHRRPIYVKRVIQHYEKSMEE